MLGAASPPGPGEMGISSALSSGRPPTPGRSFQSGPGEAAGARRERGGKDPRVVVVVVGSGFGCPPPIPPLLPSPHPALSAPGPQGGGRTAPPVRPPARPRGAPDPPRGSPQPPGSVSPLPPPAPRFSSPPSTGKLLSLNETDRGGAGGERRFPSPPQIWGAGGGWKPVRGMTLRVSRRLGARLRLRPPLLLLSWAAGGCGGAGGEGGGAGLSPGSSRRGRDGAGAAGKWDFFFLIYLLRFSFSFFLWG